MRRRGRRASGFYTKHGKTRPITPRARVIYHTGIGFKPVPGIVEEIKKEWQKNPDRKTASDLEALCYLQTVSTAGPMSRQGHNIFTYLFAKWTKEKGISPPLSFLKEHQKLSDYDKSELQRLKAWIFEQQKKDLTHRRRAAKRAEEPKDPPKEKMKKTPSAKLSPQKRAWIERKRRYGKSGMRKHGKKR